MGYYFGCESFVVKTMGFFVVKQWDITLDVKVGVVKTMGYYFGCESRTMGYYFGCESRSS
jgi:hypothetical protein